MNNHNVATCGCSSGVTEKTCSSYSDPFPLTYLGKYLKLRGAKACSFRYKQGWVVSGKIRKILRSEGIVVIEDAFGTVWYRNIRETEFFNVK